MTQEEKINYMRIACNICEFNIKEEDLDLLISLYELILETKGEANIKDVLEVKSKVTGRWTIERIA